jgi:16S rRNA (guanine527-N7)-methyltransferase
MLAEERIVGLLDPFGVRPSPGQIAQIVAYLELLLRWNKQINLTSILDPERCITRHFGESLVLARWVELEGRLLDIGSGAGFPGLALKIVAPRLAVTLLEPVAKKRAFLKEVCRTIDAELVEIRSERVEEYAAEAGAVGFNLVTLRAVGCHEFMFSKATDCLKEGGRMCIWTTSRQAVSIGKAPTRLQLERTISLPFSTMREIRIWRK